MEGEVGALAEDVGGAEAAQEPRVADALRFGGGGAVEEELLVWSGRRLFFHAFASV